MELNPFELVKSKCFDIDVIDKEYNDVIVSYDYLVKSITSIVDWEVVLRCGDYCGDIFYFGKDNKDNFYYLSIGYGSCDCCDVLYSCNTDIEVYELRESLKRRIRKFSNLLDFEDWFNEFSYFDYYDEFEIEKFITFMNDKYNLKLIFRENI